MSSMIFTDLAVQEPSKGMMIDNEKLRLYVFQTAPSLFESDDNRIVSSQFVHGQSNPTYLLSIGTRKYVLRKQPPGLLLPGAHDVIREASIIKHLSTLEGVPVPKIYCMCLDADVIGTPFYIMEHIKGIVHTDPGLPSLTSDQRKKTYTAATRVLASIHSVQVLPQFLIDCASNMMGVAMKMSCLTSRMNLSVLSNCWTSRAVFAPSRASACRSNVIIHVFYSDKRNSFGKIRLRSQFLCTSDKVL